MIHDVQFKAQYGVDLQNFVQFIDPIKQFRTMKELSHPKALRCTSQSKELDELQLTLKNARLDATILANALGAAAIADLGRPQATNSPRQQSVYISAHSSTPIVIDTGASTSLTPNSMDFITPIKLSLIHI